MVESTSQTIATVERAADVLLLFARPNHPHLGVTDIAEELSLSKAAVHRILASLRSRGFIELIEESRRYQLGPASLSLGIAYLARIDVRQLAAAEGVSPELRSNIDALGRLLRGQDAHAWAWERRERRAQE